MENTSAWFCSLFSIFYGLLAQKSEYKKVVKKTKKCIYYVPHLRENKVIFNLSS